VNSPASWPLHRQVGRRGGRERGREHDFNYNCVNQKKIRASQGGRVWGEHGEEERTSVPLYSKPVAADNSKIRQGIGSLGGKHSEGRKGGGRGKEGRWKKKGDRLRGEALPDRVMWRPRERKRWGLLEKKEGGDMGR